MKALKGDHLIRLGAGSQDGLLFLDLGLYYSVLLLIMSLESSMIVIIDGLGICTIFTMTLIMVLCGCTVVVVGCSSEVLNNGVGVGGRPTHLRG